MLSHVFFLNKINSYQSKTSEVPEGKEHSNYVLQIYKKNMQKNKY